DDAAAPARGAAGRDGAGPLLGELARLESALSGALAGPGLDEGGFGAVTARLEDLLTTWKQARGPADGDGAEAADLLRSASAEQVLDFIDNELGVS
ncbi:hypothetical protein, partial [Actinomadura roseirufa]|uniref:hypothetical protein n=1 Tax=Actinomadura roseirufa TaxID=2094049 RepID=UPI0013F1794F